MTTVSIIIPTFNRANTLRRALASVYQQSSPAYQVIVVDDGSIDGTAELIRNEFPEAVYHYQTNSGVSAARNCGMQLASGQWYAFLDSDDEWLPEKLARQNAFIVAKPQTKLVHSNEIWIRNGKRVNEKTIHKKQGGDIFDNCLKRCVISPSSVLIHKSVITEIGPFDEALPACEDYDMWLRYCARYPVGFVEQPLIIKYGGHNDQLSRKYWGMDRFRIQALLKLLKSGSLNQSQYDATLRMLEYKLRIFINGAEKRNNRDGIDRYKQLLSELVETC